MRAIEASGEGAAVFAVPLADTCKEVADGLVVRTVPRDSLAVALGPWVFERDALSRALAVVAGRASEIDSLLELCELTHLQVRVLPPS
jgi:2-C-methyl-D-erythritol 4-phosphate cytidylyltransferase